MEDGGIASTTTYGYTKLMSSLVSTNTAMALTPYALNRLLTEQIFGYSPYSASNTYAVGDIVRYSWGIYQCNTAITTAESWTAAHWTDITTTLKSQIDGKASKITALNPALTSSSGKCTWTITNSLGTGDVTVNVKDTSTNKYIVHDTVSTDSTITITIISSNNISADSLKAIITG